MATIREDVVKINFDVDNPFKEITSDAEEMKEAIEGSTESGTKSIKNMVGGAAKAVAGMAKTSVKVLAAGATAAAGAVGAIVTKSVQAYADYEQLVGGVETLFGTGGKNLAQYAQSVGKTTDEVQNEYARLNAAEEAVIKNAQNAYKTAGLSANDYIDTVTSFSASLIQSVGGDTVKAADMADMAITDMSDNANKMGSDIETIKTAYSGFAKGQFTLLDNLKLGYGGTQEEMKRLLKDAEKISGVKYDISSYADIVNAIHVIQDEMGITGTTAAEAEKTISGSLASMKAAWGNVLTGLVQGGSGLDQSITALVSSAKTFVGNVMPVAKSALTGVVSLVREVAPVIIAEIPALISEVLPPLVEAGTGLVSALISTVSNNAGTFSNIAVNLVTTLASFILQSAPQLIMTGLQLILSLVQGISQQLPTLIPMAIQAIMTLVQGLIGMLPQIISAGIELIVALVNGIAQSLPQLIPMGIQALLSLINGIVGAIPQLIQAALGLVPVVIDALIQNLPLLIQGGIQLIIALIQGLGQAIPQLIGFMPQIKDAVINSLKEIDLLQVGKDLMSGLLEGIKSMAGAIAETAKNVAKGAVEGIKNFLGINSPSTLMIEQGEYTGGGFALGMENKAGEVESAALNLAAPIEPAVNTYTPSSGVSNSSTSNVTNYFNPSFTLNMNGASATESNKRKVKQWVKESIEECFESMSRTNPELCEV